MSNFTTKMNWLVDIIKTGNDTRTDLVKEVNVNMNKQAFGCVKAPTGIGKSGIIYYDIANKMLEDQKKKIFVISTPLLVLNDQFFTDLVSTLYGTGLMTSTNSVIANNSCDDDKKHGTYKIKVDEENIIDTKITQCSVKDGINIFKKGKINGGEMKYLFIISTHKSFNNLATYLDDINDGKIIVYLDEEHTFKFTADENQIEDDDKEGSANINIFKFLNIFDNLYTFSATPRANNIDMLKKTFCQTYNTFVASISTKEAIESGDILGIKPKIWKVEDKNNILHMLDCFNDEISEKKETKLPYVKMLITCKNTDELRRIKEFFINNNVIVYSTCAIDGKRKNNELMDNSISDFAKSIEEEENDLVILHIRQCTAGIDIGAITHTIIRTASSHNSQAEQCKIIQTIGRTLRYYNSSERTAKIADKNAKLTKEYGTVIFFLNDDCDYEDNKRYLQAFIWTHYNTVFAPDAFKYDYEETGANRKNIPLCTPPFNKTIDKPYLYEPDDFIFEHPRIKAIINNPKAAAKEKRLVFVLKQLLDVYKESVASCKESTYYVENNELEYKTRDTFIEVYDKLMKMVNQNISTK